MTGQPPDPLPKAIVVDIDGTAALRGDRGPYDESGYPHDAPNMPVIYTANAFYLAGWQIIFTSGRRERTRAATETWIRQHFHRIPPAGIYMRPDHDTRPDYQVKENIYRTHIQPRYDVTVVLDDRDTVVAMWRNLGLTCFQVAPGNF